MSLVEGVAIPESLLKHIQQLSEREGISVEQFVSSAIAEKASAWSTVEYLKDRALRGSREKFMQALDKVPKVPAEPDDRID